MEEANTDTEPQRRLPLPTLISAPPTLISPTRPPSLPSRMLPTSLTSPLRSPRSPLPLSPPKRTPTSSPRLSGNVLRTLPTTPTPASALREAAAPVLTSTSSTDRLRLNSLEVMSRMMSRRPTWLRVVHWTSLAASLCRLVALVSDLSLESRHFEVRITIP